jgi:hypothetical protein
MADIQMLDDVIQMDRDYLESTRGPKVPPAGSTPMGRKAKEAVPAP